MKVTCVHCAGEGRVESCGAKYWDPESDLPSAPWVCEQPLGHEDEHRTSRNPETTKPYAEWRTITPTGESRCAHKIRVGVSVWVCCEKNGHYGEHIARGGGDVIYARWDR